MPMNPEVKAKWLEALRSGEYEQGTGYLHSRKDNKYCCLGVLCDVAIKSGLQLDLDTYEVDTDEDVTEYNGEYSTPPRAVWEWAGMDQANPTVRTVVYEGDDDPDSSYDITTLNDDYTDRFTFDILADLIEEQL